MAKYLDSNGLAYLWGKMKSYVDAVIQSVGAITGVKGDAESAYRTGNVNLTAANIGAAASSHTHAASDVASGTLDIGRIPTGTGASQVALGNHTHNYVPLSGGTMTGSLNINTANLNIFDGSIYKRLNQTGYDRDGSAPSSSIWFNMVTNNDKDGEAFASINTAKRSTADGGWNDMGLYVYSHDGSGQIQNYLILGIKPDGSRRVSIDKASWIDALGINSWATVTAANWITWNSGWSAQQFVCKYNAALRCVNVFVQLKTTTARSAGNLIFGVVNSAYIPIVRASLAAIVANTAAAYIDESGNFRANVSAAQSANTQNLYYSGIYFV